MEYFIQEENKKYSSFKSKKFINNKDNYERQNTLNY